jgi:mycothione reductase
MDVFDLVVVGGGNAISLAIRAAKAGQRVAVVERDLLGGTCPNRGCIPSKLLLGYSEAAGRVRRAEAFHLDARLESLDGDRILQETREATIESTDASIESKLPEGLELIRGHGRFLGERKIAIGDREIRGGRVVVATGTRPRIPQIAGLEGTPYWTSDDVFALESLPRSITIVGGGYIGCELASFFAGVGVATTLCVRDDKLLAEVDHEIRDVFTSAFKDQVDLRFETTMASLRHDGAEFRCEVTGPEGRYEHRSEALLLAVGRVPNSDDLGLDVAGIAVNESGFVTVDDHLRTSADDVYCLGDLKGEHLFTHAAAFEASYLGDCLLEGKKEALDYGPMPYAVFSHPEIAAVGKTEIELKEADEEYIARSRSYTSAAKGRAIKEEHGLCKFLLAPDGRILGCHIVGEQASVLLHEVIPVMKWRNHISSLVDIIHIHPSLSEVVRNAARAAHAALS